MYRVTTDPTAPPPLGPGSQEPAPASQQVLLNTMLRKHSNLEWCFLAYRHVTLSDVVGGRR